MKLILAIIRPDKLEAVRAALRPGCLLSVSPVPAAGGAPGYTCMHRGTSFQVPRTDLHLEIAVKDHAVESVLTAVLRAAYSAESIQAGEVKLLVIALESCAVSVEASAETLALPTRRFGFGEFLPEQPGAGLARMHIEERQLASSRAPGVGRIAPAERRWTSGATATRWTMDAVRWICLLGGKIVRATGAGIAGAVLGGVAGALAGLALGGCFALISHDIGPGLSIMARFAFSGVAAGGMVGIVTGWYAEAKPLFQKGSGTVAGTAQRVLRTTVPDPF